MHIYMQVCLNYYRYSIASYSNLSTILYACMHLQLSFVSSSSIEYGVVEEIATEMAKVTKKKANFIVRDLIRIS